MKTDYIICLTSYPARMNNLPQVIENLWRQTIMPQNIILTIAGNQYKEMMPVLKDLQADILVVLKDTKVWKKFLPALQGIDGLILAVDDDKLYSPTMAEEMLATYDKYGQPVSGNHYWHNGLKCHCGCASLVWRDMFKGWQRYEQMFDTMRSSDMFYTMLAAENHFAYRQTETDFSKCIDFNPVQPYSKRGQVQETYLSFGKALNWF